VNSEAHASCAAEVGRNTAVRCDKTETSCPVRAPGMKE